MELNSKGGLEKVLKKFNRRQYGIIPLNENYFYIYKKDGSERAIIYTIEKEGRLREYIDFSRYTDSN